MVAPRREVLADGVEVWLGDCREVIPVLGKVDAVVTDPPYGIGAAVNSGKKFIGIEMDQEWFDLSCRRIDEALKQPFLFVDKPERTTT